MKIKEYGYIKPNGGVFMSFDKKTYDNEYKKKNYIKPTLRFKPDFWLKIDEYCKYNGMTYNDFFNNAVKYILDEKIDLKSYK